ncbi:MAG: hypothetical protein V4754_04810 [Pseudomonadota bacterium]
MKISVWPVLVGAGLLATVFGFGALHPATAGAVHARATSAEVAQLLLLTGGMLSTLLGALGLAGLMSWIPGLDLVQAARRREH